MIVYPHQRIESIKKDSEFRIAEYKDHFRVEQKIKKDVYFKFLGLFPLHVKEIKETWRSVTKKGTFLSIYNWSETEQFQFDNKEKCLEWIDDFYKYPIYHNL